MTLIAAGASIYNLRDYTQQVDFKTYNLVQVQGDAQDTFKCRITDLTGSATLVPEDDIVWLWDLDSSGFPTVNLLQSPAMNFTSGSVPSGWNSVNVGGGVTLSFATSPSGSTPVYQAAAQQNVQKLVLANAANGVATGPYQVLTCPVDENGNHLVDLPFYASCYVWVASSSNVTTYVGIEFHSGTLGSGPLLSSASAGVNNALTGQWQWVTLGANPPAGTTWLAITLYATPSNATNSATLYFSSAQVERATFGNYQVTPTQTALQQNLYPTPPAVEGGSNVHRDWGNDNLYLYCYRQIRIFAGFLRIVSADYSDTGGAEAFFDCTAVDYGVMFREAPANLIIGPQQDTAAIAQAVTYATNQGFLRGIDTTTYVKAIQPIYGFIINWQTTADVLTKIANMTVASVWTDPYKFLHYQPALAVESNWPLGNGQPIFLEGDAIPTFPFSGFKYDLDSTQSVSQPIIEGSTQLSAPQSQGFPGTRAQLASPLAAGTAYTAIPLLSATAWDVPSGSVVSLDDGAGHLQAVTTSADAPAGSTSLPIPSTVASYTYPTGASAGVWCQVVYTFNGGNPIAQIDSLTVQGAGVTVGLADVNAGQGYGATYDPSAGAVTLVTAPTSGASNAVTAVFRYNFPVLVRLRNPAVESVYNSWLRRIISYHLKVDEIKQQQAAIDRANAELSMRQKAKPIGECVVKSPPYPIIGPNYFIRPGTAIRISYGPARLNQTLFQVQRVELTISGNLGTGLGSQQLSYKLGIGYYRADFAIQMANANRDLQGVWEGLSPPSVLDDVLAAADGWAITDAVSGSAPVFGVWNGASASYDSATLYN